MKTIGLLFESQAAVLAEANASELTHYHWREPAELEAVTQALQEMGYPVDWIDSVDELLVRSRQGSLPDLIWNLSVRTLSRSRTAIAPALLEQLGIPYTGADAACKGLVLNKDWLKPLLEWQQISTPPWQRYGLGEEILALPP
jgi:D-alanine-D-alanine ligase